MKKFLSILFLLLASITLPLVTFESKALTNQSTENAAFNDITPLLVSASETSVFALNASDNFVYEITNNTMVKTNINGQISKMKYHNESIYYSVENQLFAHTLSTTSTSLIASFTEQIVDFVVNENNVYVLTSTTLFSLSLSNSSITTISSVFTNAKAITINQNVIYIIDVNKLYSINQSVVVLLGIISQQATSSYEIIALQDNLLVLEKPKNTINLFTYKGGLVANSLDSTSDIVTRTFKSGEVFSTDSFCKQNDKIIICDSIAKSIQAFTLNQNKLVFSTLIVASKGADTNRLNHAQDFDLINSEVFVFADTDNNRVTITDYKTNKSFEVNNLFNVPTIVAVNNLQEIYVYDNNYLTKILSDNTKQEIALPFIVADIVCDTLSNTYLFNASNNKVVKMIV